MAKVNRAKAWKNACMVLCLLCALGALAMLFVVAVQKDAETSYLGWQVTFGYNKVTQITNTLTHTEHILAFSFGNFLPYLMVAVAIFCCVFALFYKKQGLVLAVLTMLLFFAAGVIFLNQAGNVEPYTQGLRNTLTAANVAEAEINEQIYQYVMNFRKPLQVATGGYVAAICCFVAAVSALLSKIMWQIYHKSV